MSVSIVTVEEAPSSKKSNSCLINLDSRVVFVSQFFLYLASQALQYDSREACLFIHLSE